MLERFKEKLKAAMGCQQADRSTYVGCELGKFDTVDRPRRRYLLRRKAWSDISSRFAWRSAQSLTTEWPGNFPRRVRRQVIRDMAARFYKEMMVAAAGESK